LEYELFEYVGALPAKVAERLASEVQARDDLVSRLRASNEKLVQQQSRQSLPAPAVVGPGDAEVAAAAAAEQVEALDAEAEADARRTTKATENANKLHVEIQQVEETTNAELCRIGLRVEAATKQFHDLQDVGADHARLCKARDQLRCLTERASQLVRKKEKDEQRDRKSEEDLRVVRADRDQLKAEVLSFRAQTATFESAERQEEALRRELREAKAKLRQISKVASAPPKVAPAPEPVPAAAAEPAEAMPARIHPRRKTQKAKPSEQKKGNNANPPATQKRIASELPVGGWMSIPSPLRQGMLVGSACARRRQ